VIAVSTTIATQNVDLGMPVAGRVRVAALRRIPVLATDVSFAWDTCALVQHVDAATFRSATADVVATGAFPGAYAWGPPI
jgi:hypothetical protein